MLTVARQLRNNVRSADSTLQQLLDHDIPGSWGVLDDSSLVHAAFDVPSLCRPCVCMLESCSGPSSNTFCNFGVMALQSANESHLVRPVTFVMRCICCAQKHTAATICTEYKRRRSEVRARRYYGHGFPKSSLMNVPFFPLFSHPKLTAHFSQTDPKLTPKLSLCRSQIIAT